MTSQALYEKVDKMRKDMDGHEIYRPPQLDVPQLTEFPVIEKDRVLKLIQNAKATTCELVPIPSSILVKQHKDVFALVIARVVNKSLSCGTFAKDWKRAIVRPLLKKPGLHLEYKNYRPVSNISFLSLRRRLRLSINSS